MFLKRLKFLFSKESVRPLLRNFFIALGALWLVLEILHFFFERRIANVKETLFVPFLGVALVYALWRTFPPLRYWRWSREANAGIEVVIGDLFAAPANIALGCSDCYDTDAPASVNPKSLIAQLVSRSFGGRPAALDGLIMQSLASYNLTGTVDPGIARGKKERFPVGTVAVVKEGSRKIFLTVFSKANHDKTTDTTQDDLWLSLSAMWKVVRRAGGLEPIAVPVWGSGLANFNAPRISLIQIVLLSFVIATREKPVSRKLTLVIHEKDYDPEEMSEAIQLVNTLDF